VGQYAGIGPFGTFDMAGNVREWAFNDTDEGRALLGGGWDDADHMALVSWSARPAVDRTATNGIRLASYSAVEPGLTAAMAPLPPPAAADVAAARPVSDEVLAVYRRMFDYDRTPLDARIESTDTTRHWIREKISFSTAYGDERMTLYLYLPLNPAQEQRSLQTVLYWPGSGAITLTAFEQWSTLHVDFIVQSGRAVAFPVLKGTFERRDDLPGVDVGSNLWRDRAVKQVKDVRRSLDYLETRSEIDTTRLAYYGYSWGSAMAPVVLATESRFKAAVLYVPGLWPGALQPEVNPSTYIQRITVPVVQLSGRLDTASPLETHSRPIFERLGTPAANKRHVIGEGGHFVPRPLLIREALDWLDRYLGAVVGR
jgi:poly(3-hydroxybutyrate) depolymerase